MSHGGKTLRTLSAGEIFGEMALLTDQPRSATVTASSQVVVRVIREGATPEARVPFRIGRATAPGDPLSTNELAIADVSPFHVSRSHCAVTVTGGRCFVIDRGSRLGTVVGPEKVGNGTTLRAELRKGTTEIALGGPRNPFRFRLNVGA